MMFSAGTYLAFPICTLQLTDVVFSGVGIRSTTSFALSFGSKLAFRCIAYSTRDLEGSTTCVCSLNGRLMLVVERYLETREMSAVATRSCRPDGPHQLEFSVWRDKADRPVRVKLAQPDTLVKLAIIELDGVVCFRSIGSAAKDSLVTVWRFCCWRSHLFSSTSLSFKPNLHSGVPLK